MSETLQSLFVLGSSHHLAPLKVREQFALTKEQLSSLQAQLHEHPSIRECVILNTCNRLEIYGLANDSDIEAIVRNHFCDGHKVDRQLFDQYSFWHTNLKTLQHALEVSTGLDSQMLGETDILGQMKEAYAHAKAAGCTGTVLNRLFEKSFQAAKAARSQTAITRGQVSIGSVAVDLAGRIFGKLSKSRVLLLGSGDVAEKTAQSLKSRGVADITVSSRRFENARALAHELGGAAIEFSDFEQQIARFDIVICSTAAPEPVLSKSTIAGALKNRPERPCFLIDLAMPRDVEPATETLDNVYLYNLDDLSAIANENIEQRRAEIENARTILKRHAWTLWLQLRRRELQIQKSPPV